MSKIRSKDYLLDVIERFHDNGLYIPTRTIYLGSVRSSDEEESNGICEDEMGVDYSMAKYIIKNLHILDSINHKIIHLIMNSPGGNWHHGIAIYDFVRQIKSPVYITAYGYARSMTSIILQAGTKRFLSKNCQIMIHDGHDAVEGIPRTVESWAIESIRTRKVMYRIYLEQIRKKHPRFTLEKVESMCQSDCIMTGERAVKLGLADKVIG